jgi:hypothetical protein
MEIVLDGDPLVARSLGDGVCAIDLHTRAESELTIRW